MSTETYLNVDRSRLEAFLSLPANEPVVMLNLLRFREIADYNQSPELAPPEPISGQEAYRRYGEHALPMVRKAGGETLFSGAPGAFLIGPDSEEWDLALLVKYPSRAAFMKMISDDAYRAGAGHRSAALEDSRLLPITHSTMS